MSLHHQTSDILDISPLVSARIAVWPEDVPYRRTVHLAIDRGANLDLSSIQTTVHLGAHADAPSHYAPGGTPIHRRALDRYYGECQVIEVDTARGRRIRPPDLASEPSAPRVLLKTGTYPDPERFNEDFASLSPELVRWMHDRGTHLVGIDTPSVDPFDDPLLESHHAVAERDMAILEGLVLHHVPPGRYTLIALPLKLEGADASPVRAALVPIR